MKVMTRIFIAGMIATLVPIAGFAGAGEIEIKNAWARATVASAKTGAAYMVIVNHGSKEDTLLGVASSVSKKTQVHTTQMKDGMMMMHKADPVVVPAGGQAELAPGSYHVMMMGLEHGLKSGDTIHITLRFQNAGEVVVMVPVKKSGEEMSHEDHMPDHNSMNPCGKADQHAH